jgi:hypothetical protein
MTNRPYIAQQISRPEARKSPQTMGFKNTPPFFPLKLSNHPVDFFSGEANQGLLIFRPVIPTPLLLQYPSTRPLDQSGRNQEQPLPNRLHHPFDLVLFQDPLFLKASAQGKVKNHIGRCPIQGIFCDPEIKVYIFRKR